MPTQNAQDARLEVTSFFKFCDLAERRHSLGAQLRNLPDLKGLIILAPEGINGMAAGSGEALNSLKSLLLSQDDLADLEFKDSYCFENPFFRWKIEYKDQAILYKGEYRPQGDHHHLTPAQWHALLQSGEPVTILDTRNRYETKVGKFKNAIDPEIDSFTEFSDYLSDCELPKDQTTLIYCTGGIRCEKAILDMEERGFHKVYQLRGGILKYLEEFPEEEFEGECFVFDKRVAVDQKLAPSEKFWLCPHCGDPGQLQIPCSHCAGPAKICSACAPLKPTCSKDCQYHWARLSKSLKGAPAGTPGDLADF